MHWDEPDELGLSLGFWAFTTIYDFVLVGR